MTIKDMRINQAAFIKDIRINMPLKLRLLDMGFTPGTYIKIQKFAPLGDPILIFIRGYVLAIRKNDARKIYVEKEKY